MLEILGPSSIETLNSAKKARCADRVLPIFVIWSQLHHWPSHCPSGCAMLFRVEHQAMLQGSWTFVRAEVSHLPTPRGGLATARDFTLQGAWPWGETLDLGGIAPTVFPFCLLCGVALVDKWQRYAFRPWAVKKMQWTLLHCVLVCPQRHFTQDADTSRRETWGTNVRKSIIFCSPEERLWKMNNICWWALQALKRLAITDYFDLKLMSRLSCGLLSRFRIHGPEC